MNSKPYTKPFRLARSANLRALCVNDDGTLRLESDQQVFVEVIPAYTLTAMATGGGIVIVDPPTGPYRSNTIVTATAIPAPGWTFMGWLGDAQGDNPTNHALMSRDKNLEAVFGTTLALTIQGPGSIELDPPQPLYPYGSLVRATALPQSGQAFEGWSGAATNKLNPLKLRVIEANPSLEASFGPVSDSHFVLRPEVHGAGQVELEPDAPSYPAGQVVTLRAKPDLDQIFLGWTGDAIGLENPLTLVVDRAKRVSAQFTMRAQVKAERLVGLEIDEGVRVSVTGSLGTPYRLFSSTNLLSWTEYQTFTNTLGRMEIILEPSLAPTVYYRALSVP